jgi:transcriptional regulator with XRE-family HTH domain
MSETSVIDRVIGSRLKIQRVLFCLDKATFAERLGIAEQCVREFEAGLTRIDARTMRSICRILNVEVAYFFEFCAELPLTQAPSLRFRNSKASEMETA